MIGSKRTKRFLQIASTICLLAAATACDSPDRDRPEPEPENWPSDLVTPIPGATFSLSESHLPGASREYRAGTHQGFDFFNGVSGKPLANDEPVVAIADGEIIRIDRTYEEPAVEKRAYYAEISAKPGFIGEFALDQLRGRQVWIGHEAGHVSRYAHLSEVHPEMQPGDEVQQGQAIGLMGNTGMPPTEDRASPAPHLHFELWSPDGSAYMGQDLTPLETHRLVARNFGPDALPRFAQRMVSQFEAGQEISESYPPEELPEVGFQVDPPNSIPAGNAFAIPITWENAEFSVQDFFSSLGGRPLGLIDAGNGAWILGAIPLQSAGDALNLSIGAIDVFGRTIAGQRTLQVTAQAIASEAREVEPAVLERYTEQNQQIEAATLAPIHVLSLNLREPQWREPFQPPLAGNVVATFGQRAVHGVRRPEYPLPGIEIVPAARDAQIRAANAGKVALIEDLPIRGKTVALIHGGGVVTIYSQLGQVLVSVDEQVDRGQTLATARSGSPDSDAVRVEIHVAGLPSNPVSWLDQTLPVADAGLPK